MCSSIGVTFYGVEPRDSIIRVVHRESRKIRDYGVVIRYVHVNLELKPRLKPRGSDYIVRASIDIAYDHDSETVRYKTSVKATRPISALVLAFQKLALQIKNSQLETVSLHNRSISRWRSIVRCGFKQFTLRAYRCHE